MVENGHTVLVGQYAAYNKEIRPLDYQYGKLFEQTIAEVAHGVLSKDEAILHLTSFITNSKAIALMRYYLDEVIMLVDDEDRMPHNTDLFRSILLFRMLYEPHQIAPYFGRMKYDLRIRSILGFRIDKRVFSEKEFSKMMNSHEDTMRRIFTTEIFHIAHQYAKRFL